MANIRAKSSNTDTDITVNINSDSDINMDSCFDTNINVDSDTNIAPDSDTSMARDSDTSIVPDINFNIHTNDVLHINADADHRVVTSQPNNRVITLGCRLNAYESAAMMQYMDDANLSNTIVINTCAVTAEAERQALQTVRKTRNDNPDAYIIVTGCAAQLNPEQFNAMQEVDRVLGNHEKMLPENFSPALSEKVMVNDIASIQETATAFIRGFNQRSRAFIQVQNGCNHRCAYCIIPFARGPSRSVAWQDVVEQVRILVAHDFKEVVLTGVDITSYYCDDCQSLGVLVQKLLAAIPNLQRLRISSLDPAEVDDCLFEVIATDSRVMPHFHLSIQAGDARILKLMRRRHTPTDVEKFCQRMRSCRDDVVFGADFIVGFPSETEQEFMHTVALIEKVGISLLHVFPYSVRNGTAAANLPQLPRDIIKERAQRLRAIGKRNLNDLLKNFVGRTVNVLVEKDGFGHCDHFLPVLLPSAISASTVLPPALSLSPQIATAAGTAYGRKNDIVSVLIDGVANDKLVAHMANDQAVIAQFG